MSNTFEFTARTFKGDAFRLGGFTSSSTLNDIVSKVHSHYPTLNKNSISLVYNGTAFTSKDLHKTVSDLKLSNKATFFIVIRVDGG